MRQLHKVGSQQGWEKIRPRNDAEREQEEALKMDADLEGAESQEKR